MSLCIVLIRSGYGPFVGNYGLGVDQILGAKVVNHEGKIVDADEKMLQVIRGGGGTLGVIVAMTVMVYPLDKVPRHILGAYVTAESDRIINRSWAV